MVLDINNLIDKAEGSDMKPIIRILSKAIAKEWDSITTFMLVYKEIFGHTLCKDFCEQLVDYMHDVSGMKGQKWSIEQTNELARKNSIEFGNDYTEYEFNAVVHMMYYDYHEDIKESGVSSDNIYAKMADSYLTDPDAPKGKLVNQFFFIARG